MSQIVLFTVITLSVLGLLSAVVLYFVAQKFKVFEDPRIDVVVEVLPSANCGGCGFAGCRNFAEDGLPQGLKGNTWRLDNNIVIFDLF